MSKYLVTRQKEGHNDKGKYVETYNSIVTIIEDLPSEREIELLTQDDEVILFMQKLDETIYFGVVK